MEDNQENSIQKNIENPIVELEYFIDNEEKKKGKLSLNYSGDKITYEDITNAFYLFLLHEPNSQISDIKQSNIIYEFIKYFDGDRWILLNEKRNLIIDDKLTLDKLKLMIKANVLNKEKMDIKYKEENNDAPLNVIVLTANPLMDGAKELRTMNDYNIISSKIYDIFWQRGYIKNTIFGPLTIKTLKDAISNEQKRPVVLHLICKSTYLIPENPNESKENCTKLIFEKNYNYNQSINNYDLEFIDKKRLKEDIFNYESNPKLRENVNKIILIISTDLAEYVKDMFQDFGFKNILIQHTTLADVNYVADFNESFYKDIIRYSGLPINTIYEVTLNDYKYMDETKLPIFCCCFHKHKDDCPFLKNIKNELYNNNFKIKNDISQKEMFEKIEESIPHFYHLLPDCCLLPKCSDRFKYLNNKQKDKIFPENSFSSHNIICYKKFKYYKKINAIKNNTVRYFNICCCQESPEKHSIDYIFPKDFSKEKRNNEIRFKKTELVTNKQYATKYDELLIGNNNNILELIKFLLSSDLNLNIYGDNIENMKKFGNIANNYFLLRYYYYESNKSEEEKEHENEIGFESPKNLLENDNTINVIDFALKEGHPKIMFDEKAKKVLIYDYDLKKDNRVKLENYQTYQIYYIYVYDSDLVNNIQLNNKKIIWFSEKKLEGNRFEKRLELNKDPELQPKEYYNNPTNVFLNEYIKFQNNKYVINNWRKNNH